MNDLITQAFLDELDKIANGFTYKPGSKRILSRAKQTGGRPGESAFYASRRKMTQSQRRRVKEGMEKREEMLRARIKPKEGNPYE